MAYLVQANTADDMPNHGAAYDLNGLKKWLKGFDPAALRHGDSVRIEVDDTREPATNTAGHQHRPLGGGGRADRGDDDLTE